MYSSLNSVLRNISDYLRIPVIIVLIILMVITLILFGSLIAEVFTERRHLKVKMPQLVEKLKNADGNHKEIISQSGLLKRQKAALIEILNHPDLTNEMREALALEMIEEEKARFARIVKISDMVAKLGPIFGLLGTLIPLGPGIVALGQGDTITLSQSIMSAFDTTVAGLISAAIAMVISSVRKGWYAKYMTILEALMVCELEVMKNA